MATASKSTPGPEAPSFKPSQTMGMPNAGLPNAEGVSVDKIRDLLFGNQMQDYDRRFTSMEERLLQKVKELESETARHLSGLESSAKKQLESMGNQFRGSVVCANRPKAWKNV